MNAPGAVMHAAAYNYDCMHHSLGCMYVRKLSPLVIALYLESRLCFLDFRSRDRLRDRECVSRVRLGERERERECDRDVRTGERERLGEADGMRVSVRLLLLLCFGDRLRECEERARSLMATSNGDYMRKQQKNRVKLL